MAAAASKLQDGTQRMLPAPLGKGQRWLVVHLRPRHDSSDSDYEKVRVVRSLGCRNDGSVIHWRVFAMQSLRRCTLTMIMNVIKKDIVYKNMCCIYWSQRIF